MKAFRFVAFTVLSLALVNARAQVANAGQDTSLCVNYYTMQGSPLQLGATGQWTIVSGCGTITNPGDPVSTVNFMCIGANVFNWTVNDGGNITSDQLVIMVFDATIQSANAGADVQINLPNTTAMLNANPYAFPCTCLWTIVQGSGNITDPTVANTYATGLSVGSNLFAWTCDNGACGTTSDTAMVEVLDPTAIVPLSNSGPLVHFDRGSGGVVISTSEQVTDLRILGLDGRLVDYHSLPDGAYIACFNIGARPYRQRFAVAR